MKKSNPEPKSRKKIQRIAQPDFVKNFKHFLGLGTDSFGFDFFGFGVILLSRGALGLEISTRPGPTNPGFDPTRQYVGLIHYVKIFSTNQCLNLPDIE